MEFKNQWSGSTTELMEGLETTAGELKLGTTTRYRPKGSNILSRKLNEVKKLNGVGWRLVRVVLEENKKCTCD